jgi:hypothetical protein
MCATQLSASGQFAGTGRTMPRVLRHVPMCAGCSMQTAAHKGLRGGYDLFQGRSPADLRPPQPGKAEQDSRHRDDELHDQTGNRFPIGRDVVELVL